MRALTGIVESGVVKLPPKARVRDGSKVVMMVVGRKGRAGAIRRSRGAEAEDARLVQACRRSINEAMRAEEP